MRCLAKNAYGVGFLLILGGMPIPVYSDQDCSRIVSNVERLACFDESAGTPAHLVAVHWSAPEQDSPTVRRVLTHEAGRNSDDLTFRLTREDEGLTISAPAVASAVPHPYLVISCLQNISRLQLIAAQPVDAGRVATRLLGERGATALTPWQVTENGQMREAGRG